MKILINTLQARGGGGFTYLLNLLPELAKIDRKNHYYTLYSHHQKIFPLEGLPDNFHWIKLGLVWRSNLLRVLWEQIGLPFYLAIHNFELLYCPQDIASIFSPCRVVLAIRNLNPYADIKYDLRYKLKNLIRREFARISSWKASQIIFVSQHSRNTVLQQLRIPFDKTNVVYHGLSPIFNSGNVKKREISEVKLPNKYILTVSTINEHKNYLALAKAYALLKSKYQIEHHLVIAGKEVVTEIVDKMKEILTQASVIDQVHFLGEVEYQKMPMLYASGNLFVLPSILETFGHPLVEAMASGIPIAASNTTSIPEICGDAAIYFNPYDVEDIANKMFKVLNDEILREKLIKKGFERAKNFSWEKAARKTLAIFEDVYRSAS